ncbi:MAG: hypothetical protein M3537_02195 [Chloroflexota bacterium]|nr:hypothetical protein [Chloroflexota bacterium]
MPATLTGVVKAALATPLPTLTVSAYEPAGSAPVAFPYITVQEGISRVNNTARSPDTQYKDELVQVDVWQSMGADGAALAADDPSIAVTVENTLNALGPQQLTGNGGFLFRFLVTSTVRKYDHRDRVLHEAITVRVARHY